MTNKTEITAFDLSFLVREFQPLVNGRLDKIYVLEDRGFLLSFGNKTLLQFEPGKCWTPQDRPEMPEQIHPFAAQLRKIIGNAKVLRIEQVCSERILALRVLRSEKEFTLYLEIFGRGNVVLCDAQNSVITALALNNRVQRKQPYQLPDSADTFHMEEQDFALKFSQSTDTVSKTLAVQFGLGKTLADELCVRSGVSPADKATPEHAKDVFPILKKLLASELKPQLVYDDGILVDATPIPLDCHANKKRENTQHFGQALARIFAIPAAAVKEQKLAPTNKQLQKIETMIAMQHKSLAQLEQKALEEHKKGEYIYEHYQEIKQLLADIVEAKKTMSWKDVKQKFGKIKELNEATGDITVEL
jgi:predicted ribosome quality control (RQC) complex YloA/Tae2 family protein